MQVSIYFSKERSEKGEWVVARYDDPEHWLMGDFVNRVDAVEYAERAGYIIMDTGEENE